MYLKDRAESYTKGHTAWSAFLTLYWNGYNCLDWHVVNTRHQHQLEQGLQVGRRVALVWSVLRGPDVSMLLVQLGHHTLYERAPSLCSSILPSGWKEKQEENKDRSFSRREIITLLILQHQIKLSKLPKGQEISFLMTVLHVPPHLGDSLHLLGLWQWQQRTQTACESV